MGKGVIPDDYDTHLQTIGIKDADHALQAVLEADVVISVGYDLVEYTPRMWNSELNKKIIHMLTLLHLKFTHFIDQMLKLPLILEMRLTQSLKN